MHSNSRPSNEVKWSKRKYEINIEGKKKKRDIVLHRKKCDNSWLFVKKIQIPVECPNKKYRV